MSYLFLLIDLKAVNPWDVVILALVALAVFFALRHLIKNRGKSCSCSSDGCMGACGGCAMRGSCKKADKKAAGLSREKKNSGGKTSGEQDCF